MPFIKQVKKSETIPAEQEDVRGRFGTYQFMPKIQHDYIPEEIEDIEDIYIDMFPCDIRSRILRLTGHIRYLRQLLHEHGIPYQLDKALIEKENTYYYTKVSRWESR